jgi:hypothetical protein
MKINRYIVLTVALIGVFLNTTTAQPTTWTSTGIGGGGALYSPSINPANPNEIYIGCDMTELFQTTNQGASWTEKSFQQIQGGLYSDMQFTNDPMIRYCVSHAAKNNVDQVRPFKSNDGGATWNALTVPLDPATPIVQFFVDYNNPNRLVLVDYAQIFLSTNGGVNFTRIYQTAGSHIGKHVAGVHFDGNNIYICCDDGLYTSTDNGATWNWMITEGIPATDKILSFTSARTGDSLKFVCLTASRVWAGIRPGSTYWGSTLGVFTMMNANRKWQSHTAGLNYLTGDYVVWLGMARNDTSTIYAAGGSGALNPIVMKSVNSQPWTHKFIYANNQNITTGWSGEHGDGTWDYGSAPQGFQVCPSNPNIVVTTDLGFTHITTDGGTTWRQMYVNAADQNLPNAWTPRKKTYHSVGLENTGAWQITWLDAQKVMASFTDIGGITSADGGDSWKRTAILENSTYRIIKHSDGKVYAATSSIHDMYQSTKIYDQNIDAGGGKLYVSTDNGEAFTVLKDFAHPVIWIATDPTDPSVMYAAIVHSDVSIGGIYKTSDIQNGTAATWTKLPNPSRGNGHPFNVRVLNNGDLLTTYSAHVPAATNQFASTSGVFYFDKTSQTWSDRSHSNMQFWTKDIVIDPSDATQSTWYACVFQGWGNFAMQGTGGLYRTRDKGLTWTKISSEFRVNSMSIHPTHPNIGYYTTETNGLWYTTNLNATTPTFSLVSSYPFRHPMRVFFNPYDVREVWMTSFGNGIKRGIDPNITILPVELVNFNGHTEGSCLEQKITNVQSCKHVLTWETASEIGTNTFELQVLANDNTYKTIGTIKAKNQASKYAFTNDQTSARFVTSPTLIDYYRLKINDFDGKTAFSKIISLENGKILRGVKVYPNPATDELTIENADGEAIEIVNVLGQVVLSISDPTSSRFVTSTTLIDIHLLKTGIYFVKTAGEVVRFVKN